MRFGENYIKFSPNERKVLLEMWKDLTKYTFPPLIKKMKPIIEKLRNTSKFTLEEWEEYMDWRAPIGTPLARPKYYDIICLYFKKRKCKTCNGTGHDTGMNVCNVCHSSGVDPKVKELLGK
jgi:hypothetical protein